MQKKLKIIKLRLVPVDTHKPYNAVKIINLESAHKDAFDDLVNHEGIYNQSFDVDPATVTLFRHRLLILEMRFQIII